MNEIWDALKQGLQCAFVEVIFVVAFVFGRATGDGVIDPIILWVSFVVAALWVLITCSRASFEDAKQYILEGELFISDFAVSAALLVGGAIVIGPYAWYFPVMWLVAAAQNIRYIYFSVVWIKEDDRKRRRKSRNDSMS